MTSFDPRQDDRARSTDDTTEPSDSHDSANGQESGDERSRDDADVRLEPVSPGQMSHDIPETVTAIDATTSGATTFGGESGDVAGDGDLFTSTDRPARFGDDETTSMVGVETVSDDRERLTTHADDAVDSAAEALARLESDAVLDRSPDDVPVPDEPSGSVEAPSDAADVVADQPQPTPDPWARIVEESTAGQHRETTREDRPASRESDESRLRDDAGDRPYRDDRPTRDERSARDDRPMGDQRPTRDERPRSFDPAERVRMTGAAHPA